MEIFWNMIQNELGFSLRGFVVVMLAMIPNILFVIYPTTNKKDNLKSGGWFIDALEHGTQFIYIAMFIFMTSKEISNNIFIIGMIPTILIYYGLWLKYFLNGRDFVLLFSTRFCGIPSSMVVFPVLYFLFAALWLQNIPILVLVLIYFIGHMCNSYITSQQLHKLM